MNARPLAVFLFNLLQDVNIARPLVSLVASEMDSDILLLMSAKFIERDAHRLWQAELQALHDEVGAELQVYDSEFAAYGHLAGRSGLIVASSESSLSAHANTHNVFTVAPASFMKLTLQHGLECVGFLQNRDHIKAHGRTVTFGADVVCGWSELPRMQSMAPSERSKYWMTGATALLRSGPAAVDEATGTPIVCENLHSVRLGAGGDFRKPFMETFFAFCERMEEAGKRVTLRPHPGGQYVLKNNVELPPNVDLNNEPMYRVDLRRYRFGISAPSSVLIDMVLAGIPTAVWQDAEGQMDATHYEGLTVISGLDDWLAFERDVRLRPQAILQRQQRYLSRSGLLLDRDEVRSRFLQVLLACGLPRRRAPRAIKA